MQCDIDMIILTDRKLNAFSFLWQVYVICQMLGIQCVYKKGIYLQ